MSITAINIIVTLVYFNAEVSAGMGGGGGEGEGEGELYLMLHCQHQNDFAFGWAAV